MDQRKLAVLAAVLMLTGCGSRIGENGDISVCPLPTCPEILGNIRDHTLPELWNSERRRKILLDHAVCQRENCEACNGCTQPQMLAGGAQPSAGLAERIREHLEKSRSVK